MSSTNKTTNFALSQFAATDKPSWLTDYNADMLKLDTAVQTAITNAVNAQNAAYSKTESDAKYVEKSATAPQSTGLTAAQYDALYVDADGIVRVKASA